MLVREVSRDRRRRTLLLLALGTTLIGAGTARAVSFSPQPLIHDGFRPVPFDAENGAAFGNDVLVTHAGHVDLFEGATGSLLRTFLDPVGNPLDRFGCSMAPLGSNVLIGASGGFYSFGNLDGHVYLFDGATGALLRTIDFPDPSQRVGFGCPVAGIGTHVLVGRSLQFGGSAGVLYLFDLTSGALEATIGVDTHERSGQAIAAAGSNFATVDRSATHLFDAATGAPQATFTSATGNAIASVGSNLLVGAPGALLIDGSTGSVVRDYGGTFTLAPVGADVVLGPPDDLDSFGSARLLDGATASLLYTFLDPDPVTGNLFGFWVAGAGDNVVVGAPWQKLNTTARVFPSHAYLFGRCGNGVRTEGEQCDDGNEADGDGCSSTCRLEACPASPRSGCRTTPPGMGRLVLTTHLSTGLEENRRDSLTWTWTHGAATSPAEFSDPRTTASYVLCLYDSSGAPQPLVGLAAPAGGTCAGLPCWAAAGTTGFGYKDPRLTPDGLLRARLASGTDAHAKITVAGKGVNLHLPALPLSTPVTVQMVNTTSGLCWDATYTTPLLNTAPTPGGTGRFKALSD